MRHRDIEWDSQSSQPPLACTWPDNSVISAEWHSGGKSDCDNWKQKKDQRIISEVGVIDRFLLKFCPKRLESEYSLEGRILNK